jgi:hypothetical protein
MTSRVSSAGEGQPRSGAQAESDAEYSRRTVLAGAAAVTAVATLGIGDASLPARAAPLDAAKDMRDFVELSAKLTGIAAPRLAPGVDPINIKRIYFGLLAQQRPAAFEKLLQMFRDHRTAPNLLNIVIENPELKYLARSIVLMWYLGAWYDPDHLRALAERPNPPEEASSFRVISSTAYTQGWVWRIARAHPMGYSDLQFGYWQRKPPELPKLIGGAS